MKIIFYCTDCQIDGPAVQVTPIGFAYGTEQNARDLHGFLASHFGRDHDIAIRQEH